jgi:monothiol glutaredoxin
LKVLLDGDEALHLFDVRSAEERAAAQIPGARVLDEQTAREIEALPKDTRLIFHCHHGSRSLKAAEHFLALGFDRVYNVPGGIDAWSRQVDTSVPRY